MNKRNFGRVIRRIEKHNHWNQSIPPEHCAKNNGAYDEKCGTPYCFLGHAEYVRTGGKRIAAPADRYGWRRNYVSSSRHLAKWLGLTMRQLNRVFACRNRMRDFKRWHKAGRVPE